MAVTTGSSASGAANAPINVPIEYTRGTGSFFPTGSTTASQSAITAQGTLAPGITLAPATTAVQSGTSLPKTGVVGQQFFDTSTNTLKTFNGKQWV